MSLLEKLDEKILAGASKIAYGYNALTGRPSADLFAGSHIACCITLAIGVPAGEIYDCMSNAKPINFEVVGVLAGFGTYTAIKAYDYGKHTYKLLVQESQSSTKSLELEEERKTAKELTIYRSLSSASIFTYSRLSEHRNIFEALSASIAFDLIADYFLRVPNLPPRKSIVKEKLEKLSEKLNEITLPLPHPVPVSSYQTQVNK